MRIANIAALENSKSHRPGLLSIALVVGVQYLLHQYSATLLRAVGWVPRSHATEALGVKVVGEVRFFCFLFVGGGKRVILKRQ